MSDPGFYRARISRLIETGEIVDEAERYKLQQPLTTKGFNPYGLLFLTVRTPSRLCT